MPLGAHELIHFTLSILAGFCVFRMVYQKRKHKSIRESAFVTSIIFALLGGFFIDVDHFIDYYFAFGPYFNLYYFFNGYQFLKTGKNYVFFHAYEYVPILYFISYKLKNNYKKTLLIAFTTGLLLHLLVDSSINNLRWPSYFITYRILNNFEMKSMLNADHYQRFINEQKEVFSKLNY